MIRWMFVPCTIILRSRLFCEGGWRGQLQRDLKCKPSLKDNLKMASWDCGYFLSPATLHEHRVLLRDQTCRTSQGSLLTNKGSYRPSSGLHLPAHPDCSEVALLKQHCIYSMMHNSALRPNAAPALAVTNVANSHRAGGLPCARQSKKIFNPTAMLQRHSSSYLESATLLLNQNFKGPWFPRLGMPWTPHNSFLLLQGAVPYTKSLIIEAAFPPADTTTTKRYWDTSEDGKQRLKELLNDKKNSVSFCWDLPCAEGTALPSLTWYRTCTPLWGTLLNEAASDDQFWAVQAPWVGRRMGI